MNKKREGFVNLYLVVSILLASVIVISLFTYPLLNAYFRVAKANNLIEPYVEARNGLERLYSKFYENISLNETVTYEDLNKTYQIIEKELKDREVKLSAFSGTTYFNILNKTDIKINIDYSRSSSADPDDDSYYNVKVLYGDETIYNNSYITSSKSITIPSSLIYNESTGEFNYGKYRLIISGVNARINADVSYKEHAYRKVEIIENNEIKRTLVIKNNTSVNGTIERYFINDK